MKPFLEIKSNIPDGEAHVMPDGKVYVYGSLDIKKDVWCSGQYKVIFSADLEHWEESDISFSIDDVPWSKDIQLPSFLDEMQSYDDLPPSISMFLPQKRRIMPFKLFKLIIKKISYISKKTNYYMRRTVFIRKENTICTFAFQIIQKALQYLILPPVRLKTQ